MVTANPGTQLEVPSSTKPVESSGNVAKHAHVNANLFNEGYERTDLTTSGTTGTTAKKDASGEISARASRTEAATLSQFPASGDLLGMHTEKLSQDVGGSSPEAVAVRRRFADITPADVKQTLSEYDANGKLTSQDITLKDGTKGSVVYDPATGLRTSADVTRPDGAKEHWSFDPTGKPKSADIEYKDKTTGHEEIEYDPATGKKKSSFIIRHDDKGNPIASEQTDFNYTTGQPVRTVETSFYIPKPGGFSETTKLFDTDGNPVQVTNRQMVGPEYNPAMTDTRNDYKDGKLVHSETTEERNGKTSSRGADYDAQGQVVGGYEIDSDGTRTDWHPNPQNPNNLVGTRTEPDQTIGQAIDDLADRASAGISSWLRRFGIE